MQAKAIKINEIYKELTTLPDDKLEEELKSAGGKFYAKLKNKL